MSKLRYPILRPDGGITLVSIAPKPRNFKITDSEWVEFALAKQLVETSRDYGECFYLPECDISYLNRLMKTAPLLPDKKYFDAWGSDSEGRVIIDAVKAAAIDAQIAAESVAPTLEEQVASMRKEIDKLNGTSE